jgi:hypothetical protein
VLDFVVWLVKKLLLKFGGLETYRRATPFFLGDFSASLWALRWGSLSTSFGSTEAATS